MFRYFLLAGLVPLVAACGNTQETLSRLNPINWGGQKEKEEVAVAEAPELQLEITQLVTEVVDLRLDPLPDGAILLASGLPPTQGYSNAELVPLNEGAPEEGTLIYELVATPPAELAEEGTPESREVIALRTITSLTLEDVSSILVLAETNSLTRPIAE